NDPNWWDCAAAVPDCDEEKPGCYLIYIGINRPTSKRFRLGDDVSYKAEVIDTWNMTVEDAGIHKGNFSVQLPGREYMAVRLTKK
ncbi:MAG: DUF5605 domain-containing protein, partial [Defluviitaleaceae bacterium]|nr:DUF5605 domain-containing protein [Defluviitaleaceae bacterium]